ncbi:MAG: DUF3027 domain-containing protein [Microcella sp.]|uniref:DUF3027 domain-containing protein n=1 Tax=Microcella sp. TaxID=1913979 RepID=UPI00271E8C73|nr:DUF3027 domain-containing protein [Microcella sp.]MDO8336803.1 DUF3027 domain-containing protein [Microcella sp.]
MPESVESAAPGRAVLEPLAREALGEITNPKHVGALRDVTIADDVATVRFSTTQGGYPGWAWTVSIAVNPGMEPAILETELMPGDGALVAPDWVPWADRLEDYLAQQAEAGSGDDADDEADDDDEHDDDDHELDDDVDGVDIDLHADDVDDDDDEDEDLDDDDEDIDDGDLDDEDDDDDDDLDDEDDDDADEDDIDEESDEDDDSGL